MNFIIGLSFGTHNSLLTLYQEEKHVMEIFVDDMGSRTIPCVVAFRGDEIIVGHSALAQQAKNMSNTFDNIRSLLENDDGAGEVFIPALEKSIPIQDLASHFFRHIHNQVKNQVGKVVRDCVLAVPSHFDDNCKKRIVECAKAGGIRVKSFIPESISALIAANLDDININYAVPIVIDIGWSKTCVSIYQIKNGVFYQVINKISKTFNTQILLDTLSQFYVKDFIKKNKLNMSLSSEICGNVKCMKKLQRELENSIRILSNLTETSIEIDSFFDGMDFSCKISRARFEDITLMQFNSFKLFIGEVVSEYDAWTASHHETVNASVHNQLTHFVLAGGSAAIPKVQSLLNVFFENLASKNQYTHPVQHIRSRMEPEEMVCYGACIQGKLLIEEGMLESTPDSSNFSTLSKSLYLQQATQPPMLLLHAKTILPCRASFTTNLLHNSTANHFSLSEYTGVETMNPVVQVMIPSIDESQPIPVEIIISVDVTTKITVHVMRKSNTASGDQQLLYEYTSS